MKFTANLLFYIHQKQKLHLNSRQKKRSCELADFKMMGSNLISNLIKLK